MDVHSPSVRSKNMQAIRSKDTQPEICLRKALHAKGFRFRLNVRDILGKLDIVLPKYQAVIFVHGCFLHGHNCHLFKLPQTRREFWQTKISGNKLRDEMVKNNLLADGWRVAIVWECALKGRNKAAIDVLISDLAAWLSNTQIQTIEFAGDKQT